MRKLMCITMMLISILAFSQINIWEGTSCKNKVKLTPYIVDGENNIAIIVCPGGSYFWHDTETEGTKVAEWLNSIGISAFVLDYRTANVPAFITHYRLLFRGNRYPDPQDDLRQAIRLVRKNADDWGIDPLKIGAMGFSAGGHLVMSSVELFDKEDWPNFIAPIYPVVTMTDVCVHKRSRRGLLGDNKQGDNDLRNLLSLEKHIPIDCPPVFLVNCKDDPIVDYRNSMLLDSALTSNNVNHRYIQYQTGGHGFGASSTKGSEECRNWTTEFSHWLQEILR